MFRYMFARFSLKGPGTKLLGVGICESTNVIQSKLFWMASI